MSSTTATASTRRRERSTRKRKKTSNSRSSLQLDLEHAIQMPRGVHRTMDLVRAAHPHDIPALNNDYSPLTDVILLTGSMYTRRRGNRIPADLMPTIKSLIQLCHDRGISMDGGRKLGDSITQRPLVLAAYYGFRDLVEALLDLGSTTVDKADGEGRTAWHAALSNPAGQNHILRDCDKEIAQLLVQRGFVTASLKDWKQQHAKGSLMYMNGDAIHGSALLTAIRHKNHAAVQFLVHHGAVLTDRDYLALTRKRGGTAQLEAAVSRLVLDNINHSQQHASSSLQQQHVVITKCWSIHTDWSFPPTWKVAIQLSSYCGLPREIFEDHVRPYLARDWFYSKEQRNGPLPAPLRASLE